MAKRGTHARHPPEWMMVDLHNWRERNPGVEMPEPLLEAFRQHFERVDREQAQLEASRDLATRVARQPPAVPPSQPMGMPRPRGWRDPELAAKDAARRQREREEAEALYRARREDEIRAAAKGRVKLQPGELRRKKHGGV